MIYTATRLIRAQLDAQTFAHPFIGGTRRDYDRMERSASVERGLKVYELRPSRYSNGRYKAAGAAYAQFAVEYRTLDGYVTSPAYPTLAQAMTLYRLQALDANLAVDALGRADLLP